MLPEGTTYKEIAVRAGVGVASVYRYFPTKGAIYAEVAREAQRELLEGVQSILAQNGLSIDEAIEQLCRLGVAVPLPLRKTLDLSVPFTWSQEHAISTFSTAIDSITEWLKRRIAPCPPDLRQRVFAAFSAARGLMIFSSMMEGVASDEELVRQMRVAFYTFLSLRLPAALAQEPCQEVSN